MSHLHTRFFLALVASLGAFALAAAVFWHLGDVAAGDIIEIAGGDGRALRYRVVKTWDYDLSTIPMASVLAQGNGDQVTLMTCSGSYTRSAGYDHRFVVRAQRI